MRLNSQDPPPCPQFSVPPVSGLRPSKKCLLNTYDAPSPKLGPGTHQGTQEHVTPSEGLQF